MPEKKHLRGVGEKEQRRYEHIKEGPRRRAATRGARRRSAARTVMNQHRLHSMAFQNSIVTASAAAVRSRVGCRSPIPLSVGRW
jgi:hypothetical protein